MFCLIGYIIDQCILHIKAMKHCPTSISKSLLFLLKFIQCGSWKCVHVWTILISIVQSSNMYFLMMISLTFLIIICSSKLFKFKNICICTNVFDRFSFAVKYVKIRTEYKTCRINYMDSLELCLFTWSDSLLDS